MAVYTEDDWKTALAAVAALPNFSGSDELRLESQSPRWIKVQGSWAVERKTFIEWVAEQLEDPTTIGFITRRMVAEKMISPMRSTTRNGEPIRFHTMNSRILSSALEDLYAD